MPTNALVLPNAIRQDVLTLWDYHNMHHELRPCDVGVGLGSHDSGVATAAAALYHRGLFPRIVFTGASTPTTVGQFPRGEAMHYRETALHLGVPPEAILVEPRARNTGENITFTRDLLSQEDIHPSSVLLVCRPSQQRRAYATCKRLWPEVDAVCESTSLPLDAYIASIGDIDRVGSALVGDTQRIAEYAKRGFAAEQDVPEEVTVAYRHLVQAGYTTRLIS